MTAEGTSGSTDSVEMFFPASKQWIELTPLLETRYDHTMTVLKGNVIVAGGYTASSSFAASIEMLDGTVWNKMSNLKLGRKSHSMLSVPVGQLTCRMKTD